MVGRRRIEPEGVPHSDGRAASQHGGSGEFAQTDGEGGFRTGMATPKADVLHSPAGQLVGGGEQGGGGDPLPAEPKCAGAAMGDQVEGADRCSVEAGLL